MRTGAGGIFEAQEKCSLFMLALGSNISGADDDKKINNITLLNIYICKCIPLYKTVCAIRYYSGFMGFDHVTNPYLCPIIHPKMTHYLLNTLSSSDTHG